MNLKKMYIYIWAVKTKNFDVSSIHDLEKLGMFDFSLHTQITHMYKKYICKKILKLKKKKKKTFSYIKLLE